MVAELDDTLSSRDQLLTQTEDAENSRLDDLCRVLGLSRGGVSCENP